MLLRNEAYIGTYIYNRDTEKLGAKRTHNPQELWIRSEGALEPIVRRDVFLRARKAMEERHICISEEEMLRRLRKVLMKKGALSKTIIEATPGLRSVSTYLVHFGTLRNIYRLIGYNGNQDYWDKLAIHQRWADLLVKKAKRLGKAFENAGKRNSLDPETACLRVDGSTSICFRLLSGAMMGGGSVGRCVAKLGGRQGGRSY
jgi:hypothetical protein